MNEDLITKLNTIFTSYIGSLEQGTGDALLVRDIRDTLDKLFPGTTCAEVIYTENTDKLFFGAYVSPLYLLMILLLFYLVAKIIWFIDIL